LHHILKNQNAFELANWLIQCNRIIFGMGLISTVGEYHKKQRKMLNPVFSDQNLRSMLPIFNEITYKLRHAISLAIKDGPQEINVLHWTTRVAAELIAQIGLGYSIDNLDDGPADEYSLAVQDLMPTLAPLFALRRFVPFLVKLAPPGFWKFLIKLGPRKSVKRAQQLVDIMDRTSVKIFKVKKLALQQGNVAANKDLMSILLNATMEATEEDRLQDAELISQMTSLMFAATTTTASTVAHVLSNLAEHPDVQEKLRQELIQARKSNDDLDYNDRSSLRYLDAICRETLRLNPPTAFFNREASEDIRVPLSPPITGKNGTDIHEIHIPKGTGIMVGVIGANCNPEIWGDDSYQWKPDRWLSPLPDTVIQTHFPGIYSNMMSFSGGERSCIGFNFVQLEMRIVLSILVESFTFSSTDKEIVWNMSGVVSPGVQGQPGPQLPLIISAVQQ